jgi:hypothetical protein
MSAVQMELRLHTPGRMQGFEIQLQAFLILALDEGEQSASRPTALRPRKELQLHIE